MSGTIDHPGPREVAECRAHQERLRVICCGCLVTIRDGEGPATHGICSDCEERYEREVTVIDIESAFLDATFAYAKSVRTGEASDRAEWERLHRTARAMLHGVVRGADLLTCRAQKKDAADGAPAPTTASDAA